MNRGKCRIAGNWLVVDDNDVGRSLRSPCPHADGRRWPSKLFPQATRRSMCLTLIVGERPSRLCSWGGMFLPLVPSRSEPLAPYPSRLACRKALATNVDLRLKAAGNRPEERADGAIRQGLRPARRLPWRIWRRLFRGLTGDDRTRCAGCGCRRKAVVAPRAFVGLMPQAGTERAPRQPLTPDGALIPVGVEPGQYGAPEGIEFPGAGAPRAAQFRFGPLDCAGGSEASDKFGDGGAEGALQ
jgi:hypothetical protein